MHKSTFEYLKPDDDQIAVMGILREAAGEYAKVINSLIPDGADKTYCIRKLRELAMWLDVAVTREADGTPRVNTNG